MVLELHPAVDLSIDESGLTDEQTADHSDQPCGAPAVQFQKSGYQQDETARDHNGSGLAPCRFFPLGHGGVNGQQGLKNGYH